MRRREFFKGGLMATAAAALGSLAGCLPGGRGVAAAPPDLSGSMNLAGGRRFRNVIFFVYDGTGYEDAAAAGHFSRRILDRPLLFERMMTEGRAGSMQTQSLTSIVTDSSAAGTTWSTGRKIVNSAVAMYPDGTPLRTILQEAKDRGLGTGLVTTTRITHATPASWAANIRHRDLENEIAEQYLALRPDVLLGGGQGPFDPAHREDRRDLFEEFRQAGHEVLKTAEELERSNASRVLGTFTPGMEHMPFEADRRFQGHPAPSLSTMARKAVQLLSGSERGFVLQVEAGRIDLANHYNDPGGMIWDWMAADEALQVLKDFTDRDGETLLIVAPDHDTGGSVVYGFGPWYLRSTQAFETLGRRHASHEWLVRSLSPEPSEEEVRDAVRRLLGVSLAEPQASELAKVLSTRPLTPELRRGHRNAHATQPDNTWYYLLSISPDGTADRPNIAYATGQHTAGLVPVILYGDMIEPGNMGVIDNTELFRVMTEGLGIQYQNPLMTEEEARQVAVVPSGFGDGIHG